MDKVICHICGEEIKEFTYLTYWCGGQGNVLRPVCKDKEACTERMLKQLQGEMVNV
jgi:hypothetical protein